MLLLALALASAAPISPATHPLADRVRAPDVEALLDHATRPIPTYIPVAMPDRILAAGDPLILYMNRFGGTYACGDDDAAHNVSSVACSAGNNADVTGFTGSDADWQELMACTTDLFSRFHLAVTDQEPVGGDYVEAVVGGNPQQAGMQDGVGGVAPFTCAVIPGAVVYAFADVYQGDIQAICETAGQEISHAFGLDHEFLCADPMTYLEGCGAKTFQDEYVPCGEFEPRACSCGDSSQNSVQSMLQLFGASDGSVYVPPVDNAPPTVTLLTPTPADEILPANTTLVVTAEAKDDAGLTVVELVWDFTGEAMFCPTDAGSYSCVREGDTYTWSINVSAGSRTFRVHVRDVAGNEATTEDRTVWLSADGSGPPEDHAAPTIILGSPLPDAVLPTGSPFDIVATIVDDNGIAKAELNWQRRGVDSWVPCPYADQRIECTVTGAVYRWTILRTRAGERVFGLRATDLLGNRTDTGELHLMLEDGAPAPVTDGTSDYDHPTVLACDQVVELDRATAAWVTVDAPADNAVTITVDGDNVHLVATDGTEVVENDTRTVDIGVAQGDAWKISAQPATAAGGTFHLSATCTAPVVPAPVVHDPPASCSAGGGAPGGALGLPVAAVVGLVLVRRRRR